jgi:hypothetical protein
MVVGFLVFIQLSESYERAHQSSLSPTTVNAPTPDDLGAAGGVPNAGNLRWLRSRFDDLSLAASPYTDPPGPRPVIADGRAGISDSFALPAVLAARRDLTRFRDKYSLTAHQTRTVDNAIAYANALARLIKAPRDAARQARAVRAWRAWRTHDPELKST